MSLEQNERGAVDITLPHKLAVLSVTLDEQTESGFAFELLENTGEVMLEEFGFAIRRAYEYWQTEMNKPGYQPSPLVTVGVLLAAQITDAQVTSIPAPPPQFDENGKPIIY
jgi:hypothetical protein